MNDKNQQSSTGDSNDQDNENRIEAISMTSRKQSTGGKEKVAPVEIRWPKIGEDIFRTGNVESRNCIVVQRQTSGGCSLVPEFYVIDDDLFPEFAQLEDFAEFATPVVFHECIATGEETIALPQVPICECQSFTGLDKYIHAILSIPLFTEVSIRHRQGDGEFNLLIGEAVSNPRCSSFRFHTQLDAALESNLIHKFAHPMLARFYTAFEYFADDDAPQEGGYCV